MDQKIKRVFLLYIAIGINNFTLINVKGMCK